MSPYDVGGPTNQAVLPPMSPVDVGGPTNEAVLPPMSPYDSGGPTNQAVLLPPLSDVPVKGPNNTRDRYGEFSIMGGVLFIEPVFTANPAFSINNAAGKGIGVVDFHQHMQASPDVWIGYTPERGWGVRGRWFQFDQDTNANYTAAPGETVRGITSFPIGQTPVAGSISANSNLALSMFDLQFTRTCGGELWTHLFGVGARYVHMSQDYRANLVSPLTQIDLTTGHNFNGWGPSLYAGHATPIRRHRLRLLCPNESRRHLWPRERLVERRAKRRPQPGRQWLLGRSDHWRT